LRYTNNPTGAKDRADQYTSPRYTLFLIPSLFATGPDHGELKGVTFIATCGRNTIRWFSANDREFRPALTTLVSFRMVDEVMSVLRGGVSRGLPGEFRYEQLADAFRQPVLASNVEFQSRPA
jgi:hypothetical protein